MEDETALETGDFTYLALCAGLLLAAALVRALLYLALRRWRAAPPAPCSVNRYDAALLTGGWEHVIATAVAGLADAGAVTLHPGAVAEIRAKPLAREVQDPVQKQVLDFLPDYPNGYRMILAFRHTDAAREIWVKLLTSGIAVPHWLRFALARFLSGMLMLAAMVFTVVKQMDAGLSAVGFSSLLLLELILWGVTVSVCGDSLPLTRRSQHGEDLAAILQGIEVPEPSDDRTDDAESGVPRTLAGVEEWRLEPGWIGTPAGRVALEGWDAYHDKWGQPFPLQFWELLPDNVNRTPAEHQRRSVLYRILGIICGVLAIPCAVIPFTGNIWVGPFFLFFSWAGGRCATLARKHRAAGTRSPRPVPRNPGADQPFLPYPGHPNVLYLRSFAHHDASLERPAPWQNVKSAILGSHTSYVEELGYTLRHFGPPLAIGNPGAALPGLGPAQFFVPPDPDRDSSGGMLDRWQTEVLGLMDNSALVVIAAGLGEGLLWEFRQATLRLPPHRLIVMVPLDREGYALFREHADACFRRGLPDDPREPNRRGEIEHALIYFDHDWTPRFVEFADHPMIQLHQGRIATRFSARRYRNQVSHAAYPVFRANDVRWPGIEIPVPFGRASRQRLVTGWSLGLAGAVLVLGGPALALMLWSL